MPCSQYKGPALLVLSVLAAACASRTQVAAVTPPSANPRTMSNGLHWMRDSAEYRAVAHQVYGAATRYVEAAASDRPAGTWGVILDADETVLDNSDYNWENEAAGLPHDETRFERWIQRRSATPVPGAKAFLERVRQLGGRIAIVTNRSERVCEPTRVNLREQGLPFDVVLCKGGESDKNPRFEAVAAGTAGIPPVHVAAWVGDNIFDFPKLSQEVRTAGDGAFASFGQGLFIIPNPVYGSWQSNPHR
jgi:5'-nucleotidase (lipoprotein e(P4) family)